MASVRTFADEEIDEVVADLIKEYKSDRDEFIEDLKTAKRIQKSSADFRMRFVKWNVELLSSIGEKMPRDDAKRGCSPLTYFSREVSKRHRYAACRLAEALLRKKLPWSEEDLLWMLNRTADITIIPISEVPHAQVLVRYAEQLVEEKGLTDELNEALDRLYVSLDYYSGSDDRKLRLRIRKLQGQVSLIQNNEAWSDKALTDLSTMSNKERTSWDQLFVLCKDARKDEPTEDWRQCVTKCIKQIGQKRFRQRIFDWFERVRQPRTGPMHEEDWRVQDAAYFIDYRNQQILKGLAWSCLGFDDREMARALKELTVTSFKKIPGIGPRMMRLGWACIYVLGEMKSMAGVHQLAIINARVKLPSVQKTVSEALYRAAERVGMPKDELVELSVPTYGLTDVGVMIEQVGDVTAELRVSDSGIPELTWRRADGKVQSSVPATVKRDHSDTLKEIKAAASDIKKMFPAQRQRLEGLFLSQGKWTYSDWSERYLCHPLVGIIARRLIWRFAFKGKSVDGIWRDGRIVGREGKQIGNLAHCTGVEPWHPLGTGTDEIVAWRVRLTEWEIRQPFKQAHREVYLLTDAERETEIYSNRFAGHILRQHQYSALCAQRGWKYSLGVAAEGGEPPPARLDLEKYDLVAEFWVDALGDIYESETEESGVLTYVATDQVRFYRRDEHQEALKDSWSSVGARDLEPVPLAAIPPLIFSEVMRDVDLFVGVTSVGNNPEWFDGGPEGRFLDYWQGYSFGELSATAQTRREVLAQLLPRLKIADRCRIEGRFLHVRGELRTYKIHLGSGNVQMEPNDAYLCIVQNRGAAKGREEVFLPFEGDGMLSIILSKALLLAEDKKIKDRTILNQIRG